MTPTPIDLDFLKMCLYEAGQLALAHRGEWIAELKPDQTPVTLIDRQTEDFIIAKVTSRYPAHVILSEESGLHPNTAEFSWVIDPIDGTRSFASGLPLWGVSIGILRAGQPYAGGFYLPVTREMYWGTPAQAYYNDRPIAPLQSVDIENPLVFLAAPSNFHLHFNITYPRVRSMGSTAAHLAYCATGAAVGVLTRHLGLWDLAGMYPVLTAVGAVLEYLDGKPFNTADLIDGRPIREPLLAAHPSVIERLREVILPAH